MKKGLFYLIIFIIMIIVMVICSTFTYGISYEDYFDIIENELKTDEAINYLYILRYYFFIFMEGYTENGETGDIEDIKRLKEQLIKSNETIETLLKYIDELEKEIEELDFMVLELYEQLEINQEVLEKTREYLREKEGRFHLGIGITTNLDDIYLNLYLHTHFIFYGLGITYDFENNKWLPLFNIGINYRF